jgi:uncharacterized membrane protein (UPF0182 family)
MSTPPNRTGTTPPPVTPIRPMRRGGGGFRGFNTRLWWILGFVLLLIIVIPTFLAETITDWMWFGSQNLEDVYTTRLWLGVVVFFISAILAAIFCAVNWMFAWRVSLPTTVFPGQKDPVSRGLARSVTTAAAIVAGIFLGFIAAEEWPTILLFLNGVPFNETDPLFGNDIGFYVFGLPFWKFLRGWGMGVLALAAIGSAVIYVVGALPAINRQVLEMQKVGRNREIRPGDLGDLKLNLDSRIGVHMSVLGAIFLLLVAGGYWLGQYDLLYASHTVAYGAGYADVNARLPSVYITMLVAVISAILLLVNLRVRTWRLLAGAGVLWLLALVVVGGIYPAIIQEGVVKPNEFDNERPYIQNNIAATRKAYGLEKFRDREVPVVESVTQAQLATDQATVNNIRLWDYRPLLDTYAQLQEIRQYYSFSEVDIDRYNLGGKQQQVMLSARELASNEIGEQSRTWQNQHFYYTHGYGAVVSPVNEIVGEGLPNLLVKDIPPKTNLPELQITRPEIYYGEKATEDDYVFVGSKRTEFDYPSSESGGEENKETRYAGGGGVPISDFFTKVLFAIRFGDGKILLNDDFTNDTRVLFHRNIADAVKLLVPFLSYDKDPYLVISEGKLYWIQDAYTTTDRYPYSTPVNRSLNYIRNSVKVVIDAYNGNAVFYIADPTDPLVQAYRGIFPALFKDIAEMPAGVRSHIRYPEDLLNIQARMYTTFHMTRPEVFYAKEDLWNVPLGIQSEGSEPLEAFYVNMVIPAPGNTESEFALILPFTPVSRDNMIAWMAARSDGANYGQVEVIRYPKQQVVYGPKQIEARINQDPIISQQITLWNQSGSTVRRGNLLIIPIANSILYVQPVFLQATASKFPELKKVIVATGNSVGMGDNLNDALAVAFKLKPGQIDNPPGGTPGTTGTPVPGQTATPGTPVATSVPVPTSTGRGAADLAQSAGRHYDLAQEALRAGDWATYGREIDAMKADLDALEAILGVPTPQP